MADGSRRPFRKDIQALRGLAILFVLLFHALPAQFPGGFLGVDVFFVVSGYLMTRLLRDEIGAGRFSFGSFYFRRAKRLLPAAYVTFAATAALSVLLQSANERRDTARQLLAALTFSTNVLLWRTTGYFDSAAHLKPLLHTWSLAIEEQFYLLLPAVLVVLPKRLWLRSIAFWCFASAALCFVLVPSRPTFSFYLLPTRGWELALGSLGALLPRSVEMRARPFLLAPALAVLLWIPVRPLEAVHPRWDALLVCLAALAVLLCEDARLAESVTVRGLGAIGDFSYSLYLVHWPLLAFASSCWVTPVPTAVRIALLGAGIVLGYGLYRAVERPVWRSAIPPSRRAVGWIVAASVTLALGALLTGTARRSRIDYGEMRRPNFGLSEACELTTPFRPLEACRTSASPEILVWGDSFAMHLVPGVVAAADVGVVQATRSNCGPFVGVAPFDGKGYGMRWGQECLGFNDSVLEYLRGAASVRTVVLSSPFGQYVGVSEGSAPFQLLQRVDGELRVRSGDPGFAVSAMASTVASLRALSKRVVVVAPPPSDAVTNVGECLERRALGLPVLGTSGPSCDLSRDSYRQGMARVLAFLERLPAEAGVDVFSFDPYLCTDETCKVELDGTFLYRDGGHLSYAGSRLLGQSLRLSERLSQLAR